MLHTYENAKASGPLCATVTTTPIPRIENGAADSMRIAALLVYMWDICEQTTSRMRARIRRRRKQIIAVTTMSALTLSMAHTIPGRAVLPNKDESGKALSTTVNTAKTKKGEGRRAPAQK